MKYHRKLTNKQQSIVTNPESLRLAEVITKIFIRKLKGSKHITYDEIHSAALEGLCEAAISYLPGTVPFVRYANKRVYGAVQDWLKSYGERPKLPLIVDVVLSKELPVGWEIETVVPKQRRSKKYNITPSKETSNYQNNNIETIKSLIKRHTLTILELLKYDKEVTASALGISLKTLYNWLNEWEYSENNINEQGSTRTNREVTIYTS